MYHFMWGKKLLSLKNTVTRKKEIELFFFLLFHEKGRKSSEMSKGKGSLQSGLRLENQFVLEERFVNYEPCILSEKAIQGSTLSVDKQHLRRPHRLFMPKTKINFLGDHE